MIRYAFAVLAMTSVITSEASDLSLGPAAIQKLVAEQLFNQQGRWYLVDNGPCYAFFDRPKTLLTDGRLVLNARLSARIGIQIGDSCAGTDMASNVTMSARPVGKGSSLTLDDIRFDHVDDNTSRDAINLIQQMAPQALPKAFSFDLLALVKDRSINALGIPVSVTQFRITQTETKREAVRITYDMSLAVP
ncbi:MAG: hypothetical protein JSR66_33410 [Proteobacteria bacterium]|nr:hypothetical protein [Pseudomonadota bacterium]